MSQLLKMGYRNLKIYPGGLRDWVDHGLPTEASPGAPSIEVLFGVPVAETSVATPLPMLRSVRGGSQLVDSRRGKVRNWLETLADRPVKDLAAIWLGMVAIFGVLYWLAGLMAGHGLVVSGHPLAADANGFLTALYFSFVTATSVGYGDVTPTGIARALAVLEAAAELLVFGILISKFVSRRQELLIEEIHRTTFEDRLGRLRTNLHLALSELQDIADVCSGAAIPPARVRPRIESAAMVFVGEMRAIHYLLYRAQQTPDELVLESILAGLASGLREMEGLLECLPQEFRDSPLFKSSISAMSALASEICGECVPRVYAEVLKDWMDVIQESGHRLAASS